MTCRHAFGLIQTLFTNFYRLSTITIVRFIYTISILCTYMLYHPRLSLYVHRWSLILVTGITQSISLSVSRCTSFPYVSIS